MFSDSFITINTAVSVYLSMLYVAIMSFFFFVVLLFSFLCNFGLSGPSGLPYLVIMVPYFLSHITSSFTMFACISTWGAQLTQFMFKKPFSLFFVKNKY